MPNQQKKALSFQDWCNAWNIVMSIYLAKPNQQSGLCTALAKHFNVCRGWPGTILDGSTMTVISASWSLRALRSGGSVHVELLLEAKLAWTTTTPKGNRANTRIPPGSCIAFHCNDHCRFGDSCMYNHTCKLRGYPFCRIMWPAQPTNTAISWPICSRISRNPSSNHKQSGLKRVEFQR